MYDILCIIFNDLAIAAMGLLTIQLGLELSIASYVATPKCTVIACVNFY